MIIWWLKIKIPSNLFRTHKKKKTTKNNKRYHFFPVDHYFSSKVYLEKLEDGKSSSCCSFCFHIFPCGNKCVFPHHRRHRRKTIAVGFEFSLSTGALFIFRFHRPSFQHRDVSFPSRRVASLGRFELPPPPFFGFIPILHPRSTIYRSLSNYLFEFGDLVLACV